MVSARLPEGGCRPASSRIIHRRPAPERYNSPASRRCPVRPPRPGVPMSNLLARTRAFGKRPIRLTRRQGAVAAGLLLLLGLAFVGWRVYRDRTWAETRAYVLLTSSLDDEEAGAAVRRLRREVQVPRDVIKLLEVLPLTATKTAREEVSAALEEITGLSLRD